HFISAEVSAPRAPKCQPRCPTRETVPPPRDRLIPARFRGWEVDKWKGRQTTAACPADYCHAPGASPPWPSYPSSPGSATPPPSPPPPPRGAPHAARPRRPPPPGRPPGPASGPARHVQQAVTQRHAGGPAPAQLLHENAQLRADNRQLWAALETALDFPQAKQ